MAPRNEEEESDWSKAENENVTKIAFHPKYYIFWSALTNIMPIHLNMDAAFVFGSKGSPTQAKRSFLFLFPYYPLPPARPSCLSLLHQLACLT